MSLLKNPLNSKNILVIEYVLIFILVHLFSYYFLMNQNIY